MNTDLTLEHPNKTLWRFALPMLLSVMFQQFYNMADSMIAGRFAGEGALAAVGASYPVTVIFMAFAVGSSLGTSVVVSRLFGAGRLQKMKSAVSTAFISCAVLSLILTVSGAVLCPWMMKIIHTPEDIFADGVLYLNIYIYGLSFLLLYNVATGVFTALGNSRLPLYFLMGSSVGNIILDYWFVAGLHMGVAGVAWATFLAQGVSAVLALFTLFRQLTAMGPKEAFPLFDRDIFLQIIGIAVPSIMQQSVLSIGNLFVQDIVNQFGSSVVAGYSAAIKLNTFTINTFMALGSCLSSYTAQNIGAGKWSRIPLGFKTGLRLSLMTAVPFFVLYFGCSSQMMGLFLKEDSAEAIRTGIRFLRIVSPFYFIISIKLMCDGIIRGSGAMAYFVLATIPDLILRILIAYILTGSFGSTGIWMAWPFGWIVATGLTLFFYRRVVQGKTSLFKRKPS